MWKRKSAQVKPRRLLSNLPSEMSQPSLFFSPLPQYLPHPVFFLFTAESAEYADKDIANPSAIFATSAVKKVKRITAVCRCAYSIFPVC